MDAWGTDIESWIGCCHTRKVLAKAGIDTMERLNGLSEKEILALRGIGPVIAGDLQRILADWRGRTASGTVRRVERDTPLAAALLRFVEGCSWAEAREHIAQNVRDWVFEDWETMFAALRDGRIVGMASVMKTDYYPLPEVYPWVSCLFVSEPYRGQGIAGELIACANRYLKDQGFSRSYIPTPFPGLYERYGYAYLRDIVNYGGDTDRLYAKEL